MRTAGRDVKTFKLRRFQDAAVDYLTFTSPHLTRTLNKIMCLTLESIDYVLFLLLAIYLVILKVR